MFAKSVFAVSIFALLANAGSCVRHYTVQEGDICDSISAAKNVSTYQLSTINAGYIDAACSNLTPGTTICLGYQNEDCTTTYVVKKDDTCDKVTSTAGVNSTILWANNPQIDSKCDNLYIGQVLCVAKSVIVPPPPKGSNINTAIPSTATLASSPSPPAQNDDDLPWCDEL